MATEALMVIAFESLENFVDLQQNYKFLDQLSLILDNLDMSSFKPKIFGFAGFLDINKNYMDSSSIRSIANDLLKAPISLPLNGVLKDRAYNVLSKTEGLSSAKKLMSNLLQNESLVSSVSAEVVSDSTSFQSTENNDEPNKSATIENLEVSSIFEMIQKSFTGK